MPRGDVGSYPGSLLEGDRARLWVAPAVVCPEAV